MILFLDLDGTIRRPQGRTQFIEHPNDQEIIPGALEAIAAANADLIVGITNQAGVAAGHKSLEDCIQEQQRTLELVPQMQSILFCPDYGGQTCWRVWRDRQDDISQKYPDLIGTYRKPGAGMLRIIMLSNECCEAIMVGDRPEDEAAAAAANIEFAPADQWRKSL